MNDFNEIQLLIPYIDWHETVSASHPGQTLVTCFCSFISSICLFDRKKKNERERRRIHREEEARSSFGKREGNGEASMLLAPSLHDNISRMDYY